MEMMKTTVRSVPDGSDNQYKLIHHLNQLLALCIDFRWSPILLLLHPDRDDLAVVVDLFY